MKLKGEDTPPVDRPPRGITREGTSKLGAGISFSGDISGKEDLVIEGSYQGKITLSDNTLTIEQGSKIQAEIQAKNINIRGSVQGNISATGKVLIQKDAQLDGDITAARISIEDGAQFKGSVKMNTPVSTTIPQKMPG